jgi:hypothetical protein
MELLDEGLKAKVGWAYDMIYTRPTTLSSKQKNAMTLGPHVKEWRVDTAHPRHTRSGCHTTAIRFRERRATFSAQR